MTYGISPAPRRPSPDAYAAYARPVVEPARYAKGKARGELIEIVDRSTGTKLVMLEDGRTG